MDSPVHPHQRSTGSRYSLTPGQDGHHRGPDNADTRGR